MISIPVPILVLPWLLAVAAWLAFPWLARSVGRPDLLRWLPPGLVVLGGAMLWLTTAGQPADGDDARTTNLRSAGVGLCMALEALPADRAAAVRAFTDRAHEPLHELAADPALSRGEAATLLRAKESVEAQIAGGAPGAELEAPFGDLRTAFDAAVAEIGVEVDPCGA